MKTLLLALALNGGADIEKLQDVHNYALSKHTYVSDVEQYGVEDKWVASLKGDCEDYALYLRNWIGGNLTIVRTKGGVSHMVLIVDGWVIDNLSSTIYKVEDMEHRFIARIPDTNAAMIKFDNYQTAQGR